MPGTGHIRKASRQAVVEFVERCFRQPLRESSAAGVTPDVVLDFTGDFGLFEDPDWFPPLEQFRRQRISYF